MKRQINTVVQPYRTPSQTIEALKKGLVVTVPTETVEGYAVALSSKDAVSSLMSLKERSFDSGKVFTLVPESKEAIAKYAIIPSKAQPLIDQYFPGELTLILPKNPSFRNSYFDHFETIGIRIPNHPLFPLIADSVGPILLTSANPRGGTPKSITGHKPSTIIDFSTDIPVIVRHGDLNINL